MIKTDVLITGIENTEYGISLFVKQSNGLGGEIFFEKGCIKFQLSGKLWYLLEKNDIKKFVFYNNIFLANGDYSPTTFNHYANRLIRMLKPNLPPAGYKVIGKVDREDLQAKIKEKLPDFLGISVVNQSVLEPEPRTKAQS